MARTAATEEPEGPEEETIETEEASGDEPEEPIADADRNQVTLLTKYFRSMKKVCRTLSLEEEWALTLSLREDIDACILHITAHLLKKRGCGKGAGSPCGDDGCKHCYLLNILEETGITSLIPLSPETQDQVAASVLSHNPMRLMEAFGPHGGKAKLKRLYFANLRLVIYIARPFFKRCRSMSKLDIIQEGNIGLLHALIKFDVRKGYKFSTYASWWIRQSMERALADKGKTIRIPVHANDIMRKIRNSEKEFLNVHWRDPTPEEMSQQTGIAVETVINFLRFLHEPVSLSAPMGYTSDSGEGSTLNDILADEDAEDPVYGTSRAQMRELIHECIEGLRPHEQKIIRQRFGLAGSDGQEQTLKEIGDDLGLSRERIRQVQTTVLYKLRKKLEMLGITTPFL